MTDDIKVPALARVEGEGGLTIRVKGGGIERIELNIYEPPRFFEGFLRGRHFQEVPDITARICGICPVAYQMSSVRALEDAMGVSVTEPIRQLRRLFYCAEYIESHALHVYMLQAPDLLGHPSALSLAQAAPEVVQNALRLKKIGNGLLSAIGGRSVHPVNACVGGFYSWPEREALRALLPELEWALGFAQETVRWGRGLEFPTLEQDYHFVALHHPAEYAILEGEVLSSELGTVPEAEYDSVFLERHVQHSSALHSLTEEDGSYLVGPLARLNLNHEQLGPEAQAALNALDEPLPLRNPYKSLLARAVEIVEVCSQALAIIRDFDPGGESRVSIAPNAGSGAAVTEAPRGALFHSYSLDDEGLITEAKIMPPTAQNLARIEADLWGLAPDILSLPHDRATLLCEELIRAYDPCISCATHFLDLRFETKP
jgi:coenzyme F420-reducing hydrogenase alpha subunit